MNANKQICNQHNNFCKKDECRDLFSDLEPLDPFDIKKEELAAQLCALLAYTETTRTELSNISGWKKSRISSILNGNGNLTFKTLWEFARYLGYEADLNFRKPRKNQAKQPWSSKISETELVTYTVDQPSISIKTYILKPLETYGLLLEFKESVQPTVYNLKQNYSPVTIIQNYELATKHER